MATNIFCLNFFTHRAGPHEFQTILLVRGRVMPLNGLNNKLTSSYNYALLPWEWVMGSLSINFILKPTLAGGLGMLNNVGFASRRRLLFDSLENMHSSKCMQHNLQFWCKYLGNFFRRSWRLVRTTHSFALKDNFQNHGFQVYFYCIYFKRKIIVWHGKRKKLRSGF